MTVSDNKRVLKVNRSYGTLNLRHIISLLATCIDGTSELHFGSRLGQPVSHKLWKKGERERGGRERRGKGRFVCFLTNNSGVCMLSGMINSIY